MWHVVKLFKNNALMLKKEYNAMFQILVIYKGLSEN